ncbi:hypothetical protein HaLaN_16247 [Haematococcus lacustris]|uniref:Uncharacterized protein n=1 Tax=Haematococcus lacustris TaxID=44745 RepID=A0A699ZL97_HAELA|nr:hypothetical protein HaLaN_16247 [Haematococcus lacustris]
MLVKLETSIEPGCCSKTSSCCLCLKALVRCLQVV